jgi:hypothetical protein
LDVKSVKAWIVVVIYTPSVDIQAVNTAGATSITQTVKPEEVAGVLLAYNTALSHDFYLAAGAAIGTFVFPWRIGWRRLDKKKIVTSEA